jgi:type IV pilus assembly protein PilB
MAIRVGELLVKNGLITVEQLTKAVEEQRKNGGKIGQVLVRLGFLDEETLVDFLSKHFRIRRWDGKELVVPDELTDVVPAWLAKKHLVVPVGRVGSTLTLAISDPSNLVALEEVKFQTQYNIEPVLACESMIVEAIKNAYVRKRQQREMELFKQASSNPTVLTPQIEEEEEEEEELEDEPLRPLFDDELREILREDGDGMLSVVQEQPVEEEEESLEFAAPIVRLVNGIILKAIKLKVSDIHFEPYEKSFRVRYRMDGVLRQAMGLPMKIRNAVIARIKVMAQLDIAERRRPQGGRIRMKIGRNKEMDFRVSVVPTLWGEKAVLRLLDKSSLQLNMTKLGFDEQQLQLFRKAIRKPYGMVLVTGPTGSGKTTTLYSALMELNTEEANIITIEDPVEFNLPGINQVQVKEEVGLSFAEALREFLRQDPDIIMVGEVRDRETAEIAIQAALTGHMVLSTLHTNDAPSTVNRLLDMGIEPFLVASSTNLVLAQRLARRICPNCKEEAKISPQALVELGMSKKEAGEVRVFHGRGCDRCLGSGYKGRIAIYEVMPVTNEIQELILSRAAASEIKRVAIAQGMKTMRQSGLEKLKAGITTYEEVVRCTAVD